MAIDTFDAVPLTLVLANSMGTMEMRPKWVDRHAHGRTSSVEMSITGTLAVQEMAKKHRPVTLQFGPDLLPASLITQPMLDAFLAAQANGIHTLVIEDQTKLVVLPTGALEYEELTPTRETAPEARLYRGTVRFLELIPVV